MLHDSFCLQRRRDFLQLMLDARTSEERVSVEHFGTMNPAGEPDPRNQQTRPPPASDQEEQLRPQEPSRRPQKQMSEEEIVGQAFAFLLAGYETSSSTLAFTCYLLALHPGCQRQVQEEVDQFFTRHVSVHLLMFFRQGFRW